MFVTTNPSPMKGFPSASAADQLRAEQKQATVEKEVGDCVVDVLPDLIGPRAALAYEGRARVLVSLWSSLVTTGRGALTLGEEYVDIDPGWGGVPSVRSLLMVVLKSLAPLLWARVRSMLGGDDLLPTVHTALFYITSKYPTPIHRFLGVRYHTTRDIKRPSYAPLGVLALLQVAIRVLLRWKSRRTTSTTNKDNAEEVKDDENAGKGSVSLAPDCVLCYQARTNPTATPCGHVYCWDCIGKWALEKDWCPLCRAPITGRTLTPLYGML